MDDFNKVIAENELLTTNTLSNNTIAAVLTKGNTPDVHDGLTWLVQNAEENVWDKVFDTLVTKD